MWNREQGAHSSSAVTLNTNVCEDIIKLYRLSNEPFISISWVPNECCTRRASLFPESSTLCSHSCGLLLPTNLTLSPVLSSVPTLRLFSPPTPLNLPNAMQLNFPWTQGSRQPHLLVTHWLTQIRYSGSRSSNIIQGFPPCTLCVAPLCFFLECCPEKLLSLLTQHTFRNKSGKVTESWMCPLFPQQSWKPWVDACCITSHKNTTSLGMVSISCCLDASLCKHVTLRPVARLHRNVITASCIDNAVRAAAISTLPWLHTSACKYAVM